MKKPLLLLITLITLGTLQAQQAVPYNETFETFTPFTAPGGGWTGGFQVYSTHGVGSSKGLIKNLNNFTTKDSATTPEIGVVTATSYLKFDYRFVEVSLYPSFSYTLAAGDYLNIKAAGSNGVYVTLASIDMANHTPTTSFTRDSVSLAQFAGDSIKVRFAVHRGTSGDYFVDLDNIGVTGAGSLPSGIAEQTAKNNFEPYPNPANTEFSFKLKTAAPFVTVELFNMIGQSVYNKTVANNNGLFTVSDFNLSTGMYIARVNNNGTLLTRKIHIVR
jgi:hypothetical protein